MGPGVTASGEHAMSLSLFVEAALLALAGFAVGLFLAYLVALHIRRGMNPYG